MWQVSGNTSECNYFSGQIPKILHEWLNKLLLISRVSIPYTKNEEMIINLNIDSLTVTRKWHIVRVVEWRFWKRRTEKHVQILIPIVGKHS